MDERSFRNAMGTFPTGVTVITTKVGSDVHGMTANAFMSVSLNPQLLLISIDEKASMLDKIRQTNRFGLSILADHQLDFSMHFAGQKKKDQDIKFDWVNGMPVIPDALAQIACTVEKTFVAGDHTLFLGKADHIVMNEGEAPLIFYKGNYQSLKL